MAEAILFSIRLQGFGPESCRNFVKFFRTPVEGFLIYIYDLCEKNKLIVGFCHVTDIWIRDKSKFFKDEICFQKSNKRWCIADVWCMKHGITLMYHGSQKWDVSWRTWAVVAGKTVIYSQAMIRVLIEHSTLSCIWVFLKKVEGTLRKYFLIISLLVYRCCKDLPCPTLSFSIYLMIRGTPSSWFPNILNENDRNFDDTTRRLHITLYFR